MESGGGVLQGGVGESVGRGCGGLYWKMAGLGSRGPLHGLSAGHPVVECEHTAGWGQTLSDATLCRGNPADSFSGDKIKPAPPQGRVRINLLEARTGDVVGQAEGGLLLFSEGQEEVLPPDPDG